MVPGGIGARVDTSIIGVEALRTDALTMTIAGRTLISRLRWSLSTCILMT